MWADSLGLRTHNRLTSMQAAPMCLPEKLATTSENSIFTKLKNDVRACRLCSRDLPLGPRPVFQCGRRARILIAGQAPGKKVHESGIAFDDASGERLRSWMGIDAATFYNIDKVAILPMGFCYPGKGKSGDLPPRPECAVTWRHALLDTMPKIELTLVIGQYAQAWHLAENSKRTLTDTVKAWRDYAPHMIPLPHPSGRNNIWLKKNPWFATELLPQLKSRVTAALLAT